MQKRLFSLIVLVPFFASIANAAPSTQPVTVVGEEFRSEDAIVRNFHAMGMVDGRDDIYRSASPVRDLAKEMTTTRPTADELAEATARLRHLYARGIRTIVCLQDPTGDRNEAKSVELEQEAAAAAGVRFVNDPMDNSGPDSLETMSDAQVLAVLNKVTADILKYSADGGVLYHCSAGHDRAGIISAYIRMKYQHWPVQAAINEMRQMGHNWPKFSNNGGISSWHEEHLRAIAKMLADQPTTRAAG
ncbi:MAG TPA: tyrosine-protein phosphatase [Tepidisphaeraceae bacterium]|nr:tyrosine-protein phosphatase [Tepidisphaeraceae bacterium]